ncbi:hypothetical protein Tco_0469321 [Tanacetum coccineum]
MYYPRFTKVIIHYFLTKDKIVSWRNKIGMHTSRDDYLINTLRFVSANEISQVYGARLPESMTSPKMRETKAYKTYLGYATGATPPKIARKFKRASLSKKDINLNLVLVDNEPKSTKKKVPAKKTTRKQTIGVVLRDTPVESLSKKKENMKVDQGKGIELLSEVALTEEAQFQEVHKKSMRDFHRTHPSGSSKVTKIPPSAAKIKPSVTNDGTGAKPGVPDVTEEESSRSEAESWGRDEDDSNNDHDSSSEGKIDENESDCESDQRDNEEEVEDDEEDEFVKTPSNYTPTDDEDETNVELKVDDNAEGDENKGMDDTTNMIYDDVDVRLNDPVHADEGFVQKAGTDAEMINVQHGNENLEITLDQVIEDAHVTISTVANKTEVLVTCSSHSSDLASKLLNFADIPHTYAKIVSPMDVHVQHEIPSRQTPTLLQYLLRSSLNLHFIQKMVTESLEDVVLAKESSQPKSTYEAAASLIEFELKKTLINKMDKSESYLTAPPHRECYDGLIKSYKLDKNLFSSYDKTSKDAESTKGLKTKESKSGSSKGTMSQLKSFGKTVQVEEPEFEVADSDMPQNQEGSLGNDDEEPMREVESKHDCTPIDFSAYIMNGLKITNLTQETLLGPAFKLLKGTHTNFTELEYDFEECYKDLSEKLDWDNPEGGDYPFDHSKPLPLVMNGNLQIVPVDYFFNNDLKYLQGGILTMTYMTSTTKTKAAQYDLPGIEDIVPNIWSPIKVAYDKHAK